MGCLPVQVVLRGRGFQLSPLYPHYNQVLESIFHALISCDCVCDYYANSRFVVQSINANSYAKLFFHGLTVSKEIACEFGLNHCSFGNKEMLECGWAKRFQSQ